MGSGASVSDVKNTADSEPVRVERDESGDAEFNDLRPTTPAGGSSETLEVRGGKTDCYKNGIVCVFFSRTTPCWCNALFVLY